MPSERALVTPALLAWARTTAHLREDEAAQKLGVSVDTLREWETGATLPTIRQAEEAARVYHRPLAAFYLDSVPKDFAVLKDLRRMAGQEEAPYSPELVFTIRHAQERQDWVRGLLRRQGAPALAFVGSASLTDAPVRIAQGISRALGFEPALRTHWSTLLDALRGWMELAEDAGIFVFQSSAKGKLSPEEVRGFALVDDVAPFLFLNAKDTRGARIFTLAHELAHVWIGASGVSNLSVPTGDRSEAGRIERFCNAVAAELVLPDQEFSDVSRGFRRNRAYEDISFLADRFKIGREVVARRLLEYEKISNAEYQALRARYIAEWRTEQEAGSSGGNWYTNHSLGLGRAFVRLVAGAYGERTITGTEACRLLQAKADQIGRLTAASERHRGDAA